LSVPESSSIAPVPLINFRFSSEVLLHFLIEFTQQRWANRRSSHQTFPDYANPRQVQPSARRRWAPMYLVHTRTMPYPLSGQDRQCATPPPHNLPARTSSGLRSLLPLITSRTLPVHQGEDNDSRPFQRVVRSFPPSESASSLRSRALSPD